MNRAIQLFISFTLCLSVYCVDSFSQNNKELKKSEFNKKDIYLQISKAINDVDKHLRDCGKGIDLKMTLDEFIDSNSNDVGIEYLVGLELRFLKESDLHKIHITDQSDLLKFVLFAHYKKQQNKNIKIKRELRRYRKYTSQRKNKPIFSAATVNSKRYESLDSALVYGDSINSLYLRNYSELPKKILHFKNTQHIQIMLCPNLNWKKTIKMMRKFPKLTDLVLDENNVKSCPDEIGNLIQLKSLTIANDSTILLPATIHRLKNLQELLVYSCPLIDESALINQLLELDSIVLLGFGNRHNSVPPEISKLKQIKKLNLEADLSEIPLSVKKLNNIEHLNLGYNNFSKLNIAKGDFPNLIGIVLSDNKFSKFPTELLYLDSLKYLRLNSNEIEMIPDEISRLKHLKYLDLSSNNLSSLPLSFLQMENLDDLNLNYNDFNDSVFTILSKMKQLKLLSIGHNPFITIPESIGLLENLEYLSFYDSEDLVFIPEAIANLKKLKCLSLCRCSKIDINKTCRILEKMKLEYLRLTRGISDEEKQIWGKSLPNTIIIYTY